MKKFGLLFFSMLLSSTQVYAQVPRTDVLECGLPDGSRFELKSRYTWYPVNTNPRSAMTRSGNDDFSIRFKSAHGSVSIALQGKFSGQFIETGEQARQMCANLFLLSNNAYSYEEVIELKKLDRIEIPQSKGRYLESFEKNRSPAQNEMLGEFSGNFVGPGVVAIEPNGEFASEQPVYGPKNEVVLAVYRSISRDRGKSWERGELKRSSSIFEIGKPMSEQCFIGRPVSLNGKKIKAEFPRCPN